MAQQPVTTKVGIETLRLRENQARVDHVGIGYAIFVMENQMARFLEDGCSECHGEGAVCGYGSCGFDGAASIEAALRILKAVA